VKVLMNSSNAKRRAISLLIALIMIFTMLPANVAAYYNPPNDEQGTLYDDTVDTVDTNGCGYGYYYDCYYYYHDYGCDDYEPDDYKDGDYKQGEDYVSACDDDYGEYTYCPYTPISDESYSDEYEYNKYEYDKCEYGVRDDLLFESYAPVFAEVTGSFFEPFATPLVTVGLNYHFRERSITRLEDRHYQLQPITVTSINLAGFLDQLSPFTNISFEWAADGEAWGCWYGTSSFNLDQLGINPQDPWSLTSRTTWSYTPRLGSRHEGVTSYTLRVLIGQTVVYTSEPITVTTEIIPVEPISKDLFTVVFEYHYTSVTVASGEIHSVQNPVSFRLRLDEGTGLSSEARAYPVHFAWYHGETPYTWWQWSDRSNPLNYFGIDPNASPPYSYLMSGQMFSIATPELAGQWRLAVYMGDFRWEWDEATQTSILIRGTRIGTSNPITVNVTAPRAVNTNYINAALTYRFTGVEATEGDRIQWAFNPTEMTISINDFVASGLGIYCAIEWRWVREEDGWVRRTQHTNVRDVFNLWGQDNVSGALSAGIIPYWGCCCHIREQIPWQVHLHEAGTYHLYVYVAGIRIARSNPFVVNVQPNLSALSALGVNVTGPNPSSASFNERDNMGELNPFSADVSWAGGIHDVVLNEWEQLRFTWLLDGREWWWSWATLNEIGIDPRSPNAHSATNVTIPNPLYNNAAWQHLAGEHRLQVSIWRNQEIILATSNPFTLNINEPQLPTGGVTFNYSPPSNFPVEARAQLGSTFHFDLAFTVIVSQFNIAMHKNNFQWQNQNTEIATNYCEASV